MSILYLIGIGGYACVSDYYPADEAALAVMSYHTTELIQIRQDRDVICFAHEELTTGVIFYLGGKVEYTVYAPLLRTCAEKVHRRTLSGSEEEMLHRDAHKRRRKHGTPFYRHR